MKVYLAARFSRLPELNRYRDELAARGIDCTSRWLLGGHEWAGTDGARLPQPAAARFAAEDIADIKLADILVGFTEPPRGGPSRGGRHVEFGCALALGKPVIVVGPRENVFYCLPNVLVLSSWPEALAAIEELMARVAKLAAARS